VAIQFITLIGSVTSTSYLTDAEFLQYWENMNATIYATLNALDSGVRNQYCNSGSRFLDEHFTWKDGERANPNGTTVALKQALDWPRSDAYDPDCDIIDSTAIPVIIKNAAAEAAYRAHLKGIKLLIPDQGRLTKHEKLEGLGEVEYFDNKSSSTAQFVKISSILKGYYNSFSSIELELA